MVILITGATGFIGEKVCKELIARGHTLRVLTRRIRNLPFPCQVYEWDPERRIFPLEALKDCESVINLAGEPIAAARWTSKVKQSILRSRVDSTSTLCRALQDSQIHRVHTFINASAIGYYGDRGNVVLSEESAKGSGFLADVCEQWEQSLLSDSFQARKIILRFGIVLGVDGGLLEKLVPVFKKGIGGAAGSGDQWMSWVHWKDLVRLIVFLLENPNMNPGTLNVAAPQPIQNKDFAQTLAQTLGVHAFIPVPAFVLKLAMGEMSALALESQRVSCEKAQSLGFSFQFETLIAALRDVFL